MTDTEKDRLLEYRVMKLEDSQELLASSLDEISKAFAGVRAWGKVVIIMGMAIQPFMVSVMYVILTMHKR